MAAPRPAACVTLQLLLLATGCAATTRVDAPDASRFTLDRGGITRGDRSRRELALVFTGGDYGEGSSHILDVLHRRRVQAGFFVTGDFLRKPGHDDVVRRMVAEGHYVGPHSDRHLLYAPWDDRDRSLVTQEEFRADLARNIADLRSLGALRDAGPVYFIPPYEWYNARQVAWARDMGVTLFNFSPGSGSNRDYVPEGEPRFVPSRTILADILAYERNDSDGLNGFILLLHVGADRRDKMFLLLESLLDELAARGYGFVRIDRLLDG